jgi:hypothetical protein
MNFSNKSDPVSISITPLDEFLMTSSHPMCAFWEEPSDNAIEGVKIPLF